MDAKATDLISLPAYMRFFFPIPIYIANVYLLERTLRCGSISLLEILVYCTKAKDVALLKGILTSNK